MSRLSENLAEFRRKDELRKQKEHNKREEENLRRTQEEARAFTSACSQLERNLGGPWVIDLPLRLATCDDITLHWAMTGASESWALAKDCPKCTRMSVHHHDGPTLKNVTLAELDQMLQFGRARLCNYCEHEAEIQKRKSRDPQVDWVGSGRE